MMQDSRAQPAHPASDAAGSSTIPPVVRGFAGWLYRHVPAFDSLRSYSLGSLNADLMAGLTVATVAVPQAMAYATLAGLPPHYGLYTAVVMTAVGALLDSSKQLINGPTNAISIALLSALAVIPDAHKAEAAVGFALLVGLVQLGITFLRLGDLTRYVSHAVIVGFTLGAGILLVLDQFKNLVGFVARGEAEDHFLKRFWLTVSLGHWHGPTIMVGFATIVLVVAIRRLNGWLRRKGARFPIPQHLVAVVIMAVLVWALALDSRGVKIVRQIGHIPASLPQFYWPRLTWPDIRALTGNAFGVAILGLLEAIAMAKAIAAQTGQRLDINQQCLSEGMANLAGSFFQCMPGSGSLTRSAVNQQAGAVSQWSGVFSAVAVAVTLLLFAPYAGYIPVASLAGLLMLAAFRMVDFRQLSFHLRATRFDALIVLATALAAIFISVEFCIVIGVFLSFALYVARAAQVQLIEYTLTDNQQVRERLPNDPRCGKMLLCSLEGEISFGAAPEVEAHFAGIARQAGVDIRVVLLFLRRARNPDASFISLLTEFQQRLQARKIDLLLCGVRPDLARALRSTGLEAQIGSAAIVPEGAQPGASVSEALRRAYENISPDLCSVCPRRKQRPDGEALHYMI